MTITLHPGEAFPEMTLADLQGTQRSLHQPLGECDWQMLVVYRGRHCPLCTRFLNELSEYRSRLQAIGIDLLAVSGDSDAQLRDHMERLQVNFPLLYGLTVAQMQRLGLFISHPRSEQETDHPFAEPGLFIINQQGNLQVVDLSNNPFVRPNLESLVSGLEWIRSNDYPIRGTYQ
ncbi:peroxiredoxin family protein [Bacterioplanes sanyensis]|nr:peroxiredoxin family protein [Bacterioplanes sanyensis]